VCLQVESGLLCRAVALQGVFLLINSTCISRKGAWALSCLCISGSLSTRESHGQLHPLRSPSRSRRRGRLLNPSSRPMPNKLLRGPTQVLPHRQHLRLLLPKRTARSYPSQCGAFAAYCVSAGQSTDWLYWLPRNGSLSCAG
jgi:hypothetical protein